MLQLKDFDGKVMNLEGVDTYSKPMPSWWDEAINEDCRAVSFKLDGVVYTAIEDPNDGYRSHMRDLLVDSVKINNSFGGVEVKAVYLEKDPEADWDYGYDVLQLIDTTTGQVVLKIGTENCDDYYPCFICQFYPEAMSVNQS